MPTPKTQLSINQISAGLSSPDGTIILSTLQEIEAQPPAKNIPPLLEAALAKVQDPILIFQIRKTWRRIGLALRGKPVVVNAEHLEKLLPNKAKLEDLALAVSCLEFTEAILAVDLLRAAKWHEFPPLILPTFCLFFKKYGNIQDSDNLVQLSRHPDVTVMTTALEALEVVDPGNLQSLITPLLTSPTPAIRGQAIRALFRWDKPAALKQFGKMLHDGNPHEQQLALHYAGIFPYPDVESHLLRFVAQNDEPRLLMRVSQIMKVNAHPDLPFRLYWICRTLKDQHQNLIKGILMGVARALCEAGIFQGSVQEYLDKLKERVRAEEERLAKESFAAPEPAVAAPAPALTPGPAPALPGAPPLPAGAPAPTASTAPAAGSPPSEHASLPDLEPPSLRRQAPTPRAPSVSLDEYDTLDMVKRVQFLGKLAVEDYSLFRSRIPLLMREAKGKELAALVKAIGRFGTSEDAGMIRRFLNVEGVDEVCAAIDALSKLDSEYLSLYLPQLMQNKNGKIRVTATRIFSTIDRERIKSLLDGLLRSPSSRQRQLAMPATVLVDFLLIRETLMAAFAKESVPDLIEKMGVVLAANPDREILRTMFRAAKNAGKLLGATKMAVVTQVAEKLAVALEKTVTPEKLLEDEEKAFQDDLQSQAAQQAREAKEKPSGSGAAGRGSGSWPASFEPEAMDVQKVLTGEDDESKSRRARMTMIVWILVILVWGFLLASFVVNLLFGGT